MTNYFKIIMDAHNASINNGSKDPFENYARQREIAEQVVEERRKALLNQIGNKMSTVA